MAFHHDLLEQASHLATRERRRPKQASLRRAVSAAYYAVFHLLVAEGAALLSPAQPRDLKMLVGRAFDHGHMRNVCAGFAQSSGGKPGNKSIPPATQKLLSHPLAPALAAVLHAFVDLQGARHLADYDLATQWQRHDVLNHVRRAEDAFDNWQKIRKTPNTTVFVTALLLQRQWAR